MCVCGGGGPWWTETVQDSAFLVKEEVEREKNTEWNRSKYQDRQKGNQKHGRKKDGKRASTPKS